MGQNVSSGAVTAVSGTVEATLTKNTLSYFNGQNTAVGNFTIGTVGAGKKWTIVSIQLMVLTWTSLSSHYIRLSGSSIYADLEVTSTTLNDSVTLVFPPGYQPVLTAGQILKHYIGGSGTGYSSYNITYVEEDA